MNHIFVIDDDSSVRRSLIRLMLSAGYQAEAFSSAEEFLNCVPVDCEGILILDLRMMGMDGFQMQDHLKKFYRGIKIIFITGYGTADDRQKALDAGASGFIQKPFDEETLLNMIKTTTQGEGEM
jgi:FixJ family two-component response regulator